MSSFGELSEHTGGGIRNHEQLYVMDEPERTSGNQR